MENTALKPQDFVTSFDAMDFVPKEMTYQNTNTATNQIKQVFEATVKAQRSYNLLQDQDEDPSASFFDHSALSSSTLFQE